MSRATELSEAMGLGQSEFKVATALGLIQTGRRVLTCKISKLVYFIMNLCY